MKNPKIKKNVGGGGGGGRGARVSEFLYKESKYKK